ncbi:MAG: hypothetical protein AABY90_00475, partial [Nitrospirota bacterium]
AVHVAHTMQQLGGAVLRSTEPRADTDNNDNSEDSDNASDCESEQAAVKRGDPEAKLLRRVLQYFRDGALGAGMRRLLRTPTPQVPFPEKVSLLRALHPADPDGLKMNHSVEGEAPNIASIPKDRKSPLPFDTPGKRASTEKASEHRTRSSS